MDRQTGAWRARDSSTGESLSPVVTIPLKDLNKILIFPHLKSL